MKILELTPYYFPEQIASSHLTDDLEEALVNAGFDIEIHTPSPTRGVSLTTRNQYRKIRRDNKYDGKIRVFRFPMFREGKNPALRALRYVLVNIIQYWKGSQAKNVDVIFGASTPPTQGLLCALVKKKLKVPFVYNLQDIFPDSMVNAGMTKKGSLVWKIGRKMEDYTYRNADRIIVISEGFKKNIMAKGVPEEKITVIPNWVDENEVYPVPRSENKLINRYNLDPHKFYISYCGNVGHSQNFEMLVEAAKQLEAYQDICFVIIGEGAFKPQLEAMVFEKGLNNVILLPFQPYEDIAHVFSLGDVGLVISKPGIGGSSVPSKMLSIMAAGRPVLASFDLTGEVSTTIREIDCGLVSDAGDMKGLIANIKKMATNRTVCISAGDKGKQFVNCHMNKDISCAKYVQVFRTLKGDLLREQ